MKRVYILAGFGCNFGNGFVGGFGWFCWWFSAVLLVVLGGSVF